MEIMECDGMRWDTMGCDGMYSMVPRRPAATLVAREAAFTLPSFAIPPDLLLGEALRVGCCAGSNPSASEPILNGSHGILRSSLHGEDG